VAGALRIAVEERLGRLQPRFNRLEPFTGGDVTPEVSPEQLHRVPPGAIGRQGEQEQPSCSPTDHRFNFRIFRGVRMVPGDIDGFSRMRVQNRLQPFSDLTPPLRLTEKDPRFPRMIIDGPSAIALLRLARGWEHPLLPQPTPQRWSGWQPTDLEFVRLVKHLACFHAISRRFDRLFLTSSSGSGRLMLGCGRLKTMPSNAK
jgi:hypothetical protein